MTALSIQKSPEQMLTDIFNRVNNQNFRASDLVFSAPSPQLKASIDQNTGQTYFTNTVVQISMADTTSIYRGAADFYYNRMDVSNIFARPAMRVNPAGRPTLYSLLADINAEFGVYLTQSDVDDAPVVVSDMGATVVIAPKDSSLFFYGAVSLTLSFNGFGNLGYPRLYCLMSSASDYRDRVRVFHFGGEFTTFSLAYNATAVSLFTVTDLFKTDEGFVLTGQFDLSFTPVGSQNAQSISSQAIACDINGAILRSVGSDAFGGLGSQYVSINTANGFSAFGYNLQSGTLSKFDNSGQPLAMNYPSSITAVHAIAADAQARLYAAYSTTGPSQTHIVRLMADGSLDSSFTPIVIASQNPAYSAPQVQTLRALPSGGLVVALKPAYGVSLINTNISCNGIAVTTALSSDGAWNPVLCFNSDGSRINDFSSDLGLYLSNKVYSPTSIFGAAPVVFANNYSNVVWLTNNADTLTGRLRPGVVQFQPNGDFYWPESVKSSELLRQIAWSSLKGVFGSDYNSDWVFIVGQAASSETGGLVKTVIASYDLANSALYLILVSDISINACFSI